MIACVYRNKNYEINTAKFSSFERFGMWVSDNAKEIILLDVIREGCSSRTPSGGDKVCS